MSLVGRTGRVLCAATAALLACAAIAGVVQSLCVEHCLPTVDFLAAGAKRNADRLIAQRAYDQATKQLELQSRIMPYDSGTYEDLGNLLGEQGRPEAARAQFQMLVLLRPDYAEGFNALGATYIDTGDPKQAAPYFAEALRLKPEFPLAFNNLGVAMAQLGELEQAAKCFAAAVQLSPDYPEAQANLDRARKELRLQNGGKNAP